MKENVYFQADYLGLGDTIAAFPFINLHNIQFNKNVFISSKFDFLFKNYKNIFFIKEHQIYKDNTRILIDYENKIFNINEMYLLAYHTLHQKYINKEIFFQKRANSRLPLQEQFAKFIDINFEKEIKPEITIDINYKKKYNKYVCIATQTTMQGKYWNYPNGWEIIIDYLNKHEYQVVCIDKHKVYGNTIYTNNIPKNAIDQTNLALEEVVNLINHCDFFIGLDSGLSWIAWALDKKIIQILGLTGKDIIFNNENAILNQNVCNSCFSDKSIIQFDSDLPFNDYLMCPRHKNSNKIFECTKTITPTMVIEKINKLIDFNMQKHNMFQHS